MAGRRRSSPSASRRRTTSTILGELLGRKIWARWGDIIEKRRPGVVLRLRRNSALVIFGRSRKLEDDVSVAVVRGHPAYMALGLDKPTNFNRSDVGVVPLDLVELTEHHAPPELLERLVDMVRPFIRDFDAGDL